MIVRVTHPVHGTSYTIEIEDGLTNREAVEKVKALTMDEAAHNDPLYTFEAVARV